jgi:hypothetical protein
MSRLPNAFLVPTAVCIGINIQKALSNIELFYAHRSKYRSQFYYLNAIAAVFNIIVVLLGVVQVDFVNSTFAAPQGFFFTMTLVAGVFSNIIALILLYVLFARLYVFYKVIRNDLVENCGL